MVAAAVIGSAVVTAGVGMASSSKAASAQQNAANTGAAAQTAASQASIAEQQRQFDEAKKILAPYVQAGIPALQGLVPYSQAGAPALQQQQSLLGLQGPQAQATAIQGIEQSQQMQALMRQGENAILQNASATGGLRGGNTQAALAQFRPQLLNQLIDQQYNRLGGMTALGQQTTQNLAQLGQSAAAGQATSGLQTGANIGNAYMNAGQANALAQSQIGASQAGNALAQGQAIGNIPANIAGSYSAFKGLFGSQPSPLQGYYPTTSAYTGMTDFEGGVAEGIF